MKCFPVLHTASMDAGLFPTSVTAAITHVIEHKHNFRIELGSSTIRASKDLGKAIVTVGTLYCFTKIIIASLNYRWKDAILASYTPEAETEVESTPAKKSSRRKNQTSSRDQSTSTAAVAPTAQ